jgi:hypothetical protein
MGIWGAPLVDISLCLFIDLVALLIYLYPTQALSDQFSYTMGFAGSIEA